MSSGVSGAPARQSAKIVVMGVSGSGKTTVGELLADALGSRFVDADSAHPPENVVKMSRGEPLTDADRAPWLHRLRDELAGSTRDVVITCSALKRRYRDVLREAGDLTFVLLDVRAATAAQRVGERPGHFMPASLVESQFRDLERPAPDERDILVVDASAAPDVIVETVLELLRE